MLHGTNVRCIHYVQEQVGLDRLLQRRPECLDQIHDCLLAVADDE